MTKVLLRGTKDRPELMASTTEARITLTLMPPEPARLSQIYREASAALPSDWLAKLRDLVTVTPRSVRIERGGPTLSYDFDYQIAKSDEARVGPWLVKKGFVAEETYWRWVAEPWRAVVGIDAHDGERRMSVVVIRGAKRSRPGRPACDEHPEWAEARGARTDEGSLTLEDFFDDC